MMRALRAGLGLVATIAVVAGIAMVARDPVESAARAALDAAGLWGLFFSVLLGDPIPGVGFGPALMLGYAGGVGWGTLLALLSVASFLSSVGTWAIGRALQRAAWLPNLLERWKVAPLLRTHGGRAIAVAAISPVPWGVATLGAGASGVPLGPLMVGAAFRPLKIAVTLAALALGWSA